jgi:hypothetical protein
MPNTFLRTPVRRHRRTTHHLRRVQALRLFLRDRPADRARGALRQARPGGIEALPSSDERAILPTQSIAKARAVGFHLGTKAAGPILGSDQVVADLGDGRRRCRNASRGGTLPASPDVDTLDIEPPSRVCGSRPGHPATCCNRCGIR